MHFPYRAWRTLMPPPDNLFVDVMYKVNFPGFVFSLLWDRLSKVKNINSISLQTQSALNVHPNLGGGVLTVTD